MKDLKRKRPARGSRREFTKGAAALLTAAPLALGGARAQTPTAPREPKAPPNPQPTPAAPQQQQQQPPPSPVAAAYAEVARARFGEFVSPEEMARVRRDLEGNVRAAERLRAHKLSNADEPDFVFSA
jgi:hypothetical protein